MPPTVCASVLPPSVGGMSVLPPSAGRGRGRGRGRGITGLRLPPPVVPASELDTAAETATESEPTSLTPEEKRLRDVRKLNKMLRQVRPMIG